MCHARQWITPLTKQCFVTLGVNLNMMQHGMTSGFTAIFLPQIKQNKEILIDDSLGSWITSVHGFGLIVGVFFTPIVMSKLGRKSINLLTAIVITLGWLAIYIASNAITIILARFFQSIVAGFTAFLSAALIGEYTSPIYRGPLLNTTTSAILSGILIIHTTGSYLGWKNTVLVSAAIGLVDIIIILFSPDSPTYLAMKGRYEDCKKSFRWLRGDKEEEELLKMIEMFEKSSNLCHKKRNNSANTLKTKIMRIIGTLKSKSFYKPILIMVHLNIINLWSGAALHDNYAISTYQTILGPSINIASVIISMDIQMIISNMLSIIIIKKLKRKTVLLFTTLLNVIAYLVLAGYLLAKSKGALKFDHPVIGIILGHFHMFSISIGPLSLPNVIVGEIFPAKYKGIGGSISILFFSVCMAITLKVTPFLFANIGIYGTYAMFAAFVAYGLIITVIYMPETKDRTLQEIEQEFTKTDTDIVDKEMSLLNVTLSSEEPQHKISS